MRKVDVDIDGIVLPGLFQQERLVRDALLFCLALDLEVLSLALLAIQTQVPFLVGVFLLLVILGVAYARILVRDGVCILRCNKFLVEEPVESEKLRRQLARKEFYPRVLAACLILLALLRSLGFFVARGGMDTAFVVTLLINLSAAVLHIRVTGFFLAALLTGWHFLRDVTSHVDSKGIENKARALRSEFDSPLALCEVVLGAHSLKRIGGAPGEKYALETRGTLWDSGVGQLVHAQASPDTRGVVARAALQHQLKMIA